MGDRSNIKVTYEDGNSVFLYAHWDGKRNIDVVRDALQSGQRVDDSAYFARIMFEKLIDANRLGTTGYGISTFMPDNNYGNPIVHVQYPYKEWGAMPRITLEDEDGQVVDDWETAQ